MTDPAITIAEQKSALRKAMRARLATLPAELRHDLSRAASTEIAATDAFRNASALLLFLPLPDEIDPTPLMHAAFEADKRVCLPRVDWDAGAMAAREVEGPDFSTEVRRHAVREPIGFRDVPPNQLDLIVVPGLAFDRAGRRLGRGKGFYDRFLADAEGSGGRADAPERIGLCFSIQLIDAVPAGPRDQRVHAVATESAVHLC